MSGLQKILENLNEGTICVCFFGSLWIVLLAIRMDNFLLIPYWVIFLPLLIWKLIAFLGWLIGVIVWCKQWGYSNSLGHNFYIRDDPATPYILAMTVSLFFHLIIGCSEVLLCIHLSVSKSNLTYLTILSPLLVVGTLGVFGFLFIMIDSRSIFSAASRRRRQHSRTPSNSDTLFSQRYPRHVCSFTLELFIAANLLQILFLIARLDNWIRSNWIVTFIPTFILLAMGFLFCLAGLTVALITYYTAFFIPTTQRRLPVCYYASHLLIVLLLCSSLTLFGLRLDEHLPESRCSYLFIVMPILLSLLLYASVSTNGPGNPWWFGLNRNVLLAIFESCPTLQLCANTKFTNIFVWRNTYHNSSDLGSDSNNPRISSPVLQDSLNSSIVPVPSVDARSNEVQRDADSFCLSMNKINNNLNMSAKNGFQQKFQFPYQEPNSSLTNNSDQCHILNQSLLLFQPD